MARVQSKDVSGAGMRTPASSRSLRRASIEDRAISEAASYSLL